eukprot:UN03556
MRDGSPKSVNPQFVDREKVTASFRMKTICDMLLLKNGGTLHRLYPKLSNKSIFKMDQMWIFGFVVDVSHDANHWPVASMVLLTDPIERFFRSYSTNGSFIDGRKTNYSF